MKTSIMYQKIESFTNVFQPVAIEKEKSRLGLDDEILGGTGSHTGTPLSFVATVAESERSDGFRLFALGALSDLAAFIAFVTDGFAGLVAHCHRFDLATLETFLVRGRFFAIAVVTDGFAGLVAYRHRFDLVTLETFFVSGRVLITSHLIAVLTDGFAGFTIFMNSFLLFTNSTSAIHNLTSFRLWFDFGLKRSEFRSPDLISYPTIIISLVSRSKRKKKFWRNFYQYAPLLFGNEQGRGGIHPTPSAAPLLFAPTEFVPALASAPPNNFLDIP